LFNELGTLEGQFKLVGRHVRHKRTKDGQHMPACPLMVLCKKKKKGVELFNGDREAMGKMLGLTEITREAFIGAADGCRSHIHCRKLRPILLSALGLEEKK
jgi:hypothetical protein